MSIIYVQVATFVSVFSTQIQTLMQVHPNIGRKLQKVILQVKETCQTKYRTQVLALERRSLSCELCMISPWLYARHLAHSAPIQPHITVEASFKFLKTIDI